jgi:hypothetical protein
LYDTAGHFYPDSDIYSFIRFPNVAVPQGATIDRVTLYLTSQADFAANADCLFDFGMLEGRNIVAPTSEAEMLTMMGDYGIGSMPWNGSDGGVGAWSLDTEYFSASDPVDYPGPLNIVQNVVNDPSWSSGDSLMAMLLDMGGGFSGTAVKKYYTRNMGTDVRPRLKIEYHV